MNRLNEIVVSLMGKEVTIIFSSGDDIQGTLEEVLADALILSSGGKIAICSIDNINMICEGKFDSNDDR